MGCGASAPTSDEAAASKAQGGGGGARVAQTQASSKKGSEKGAEGKQNGHAGGKPPTAPNPKEAAKKMKLKELQLATNNWAIVQVLGQGSFGKVYRGTLRDSEFAELEGAQVAVKKLNPDSFQGYQEWLREILLLDKLRHPNLVRLMGYSNEKAEACLVYELCCNGALDDALFRGAGPKKEVLDWPTRVQIALDFCRGMAYLHQNNIIHRDFKASNILLVEGYAAKVTDFGLARAGPDGNQTHISTRVMGTLGYLDPTYMETGRLTKKSDTYAVGVTLLELVTGRRSMPVNGEDSLTAWIAPMLEQRKPELSLFVDPRLGENYSKAGLVKMTILAKHCINDDPALRPELDVLVENLAKLERE